MAAATRWALEGSGADHDRNATIPASPAVPAAVTTAPKSEHGKRTSSLLPTPSHLLILHCENGCQPQ